PGIEEREIHEEVSGAMRSRNQHFGFGIPGGNPVYSTVRQKQGAAATPQRAPASQQSIAPGAAEEVGITDFRHIPTAIQNPEIEGFEILEVELEFHSPFRHGPRQQAGENENVVGARGYGGPDNHPSLPSQGPM